MQPFLLNKEKGTLYTKRPRQACFKANYKKRKLMGMVDSQSCSSSNRASMDGIDDEKEEEKESLDGPLFS